MNARDKKSRVCTHTSKLMIHNEMKNTKNMLTQQTHHILPFPALGLSTADPAAMTLPLRIPSQHRSVTVRDCQRLVWQQSEGAARDVYINIGRLPI